jgi:hypothetical protein
MSATVRVWNAVSGQVLVQDVAGGSTTATCTGPGAIQALTYSPSGKTLAVGCGRGSSPGSDDFVRLWRPG